MSTIPEIKRRISKTFGSLLCLSIGICGGVVYGSFLGKILFYILAGNLDYEDFCKMIYFLSNGNWISTCTVTPSKIRYAFLVVERLSSFVGMVLLGAKMLEVHMYYYSLKAVKTTHAYEFHKYRRYFFEVNNKYLDMAWAFIYVFSNMIFPPVAGLVSALIVYTMFGGTPVLGAIVALIAFCLVTNWTIENIKNLLHPHRIELELNLASYIKGLFDSTEQEQLLGKNDEEEF